MQTASPLSVPTTAQNTPLSASSAPMAGVSLSGHAEPAVPTALGARMQQETAVVAFTVLLSCSPFPAAEEAGEVPTRPVSVSAAVGREPPQGTEEEEDKGGEAIPSHAKRADHVGRGKEDNDEGEEGEAAGRIGRAADRRSAWEKHWLSSSSSKGGRNT